MYYNIDETQSLNNLKNKKIEDLQCLQCLQGNENEICFDALGIKNSE